MSQASKFLLQHYKELHEHPLYHANAQPSETNVKQYVHNLLFVKVLKSILTYIFVFNIYCIYYFRWCGNIFFDDNSAFPGLIMHFHLTFDDQVLIYLFHPFEYL